MSTSLSYKDYFRRTVADINAQIQTLMSTQALPLWINPVNTKFYTANGYKVGDIVIAINNKQTVIEYLEPYITEIAEYVGMDITQLKERNNWEIPDDFYDVIIYGGFILPHLKLQPLTIMSTDVHGFDIYISTKGDTIGGWNYDMPGMSSAWLNLRTQTSDAVNLTVDSIIEKIEESPLLAELYTSALKTHLAKYHFDADVIDPSTTEIELNSYLDKLEALYSSRTSATNDLIRMPLTQGGRLIGQILLISSTTNDYIASGIINIADVDVDELITMPLTAPEELTVVVPTVFEIDGEYIETTTDSIAITPDVNAYTVNSLYTITPSNILYRRVGAISSPLTLSTTFTGFKNEYYTTAYTPIGMSARVDKSEIQCMPVEEISRTTKSITFRLNPKYVWKTTALNVSATGHHSD